MPLKFLCNLGPVNPCINFNTKFTLMLKTEINKLFETNAQNANPPVNVDAENIVTPAPYIQYEQIELDSTFTAYLENTLFLKFIQEQIFKKRPTKEYLKLTSEVSDTL